MLSLFYGTYLKMLNPNREFSYEHKKPVYKHLTKEQLNEGLKLIKKLHTCNKEYVALLNYASLKWRNKI